MNPGDFCRLAFPSGVDNDPRSRAAIMREPQESKALGDVLVPDKRAVPDLETFSNPYTDSRTLRRSPEHNMYTVLASIESEMPEFFVDGWLNEKGSGDKADRVHLPRRSGSRSLSLFSAACPG